MVAKLFLLFHLLGYLVVGVGIALSWIKSSKILHQLVLYGIGVQLITGFVLAGLKASELNHMKVTLKLGITVLLGIFFVVSRTSMSPARLKIGGLGYLLLATIAALW